MCLKKLWELVRGPETVSDPMQDTLRALEREIRHLTAELKAARHRELKDIMDQAYKPLFPQPKE